MLSSKQPPFSVIEARISFTTRELGMLVIMKDNPEKRAVVVLPPPPPVMISFSPPSLRRSFIVDFVVVHFGSISVVCPLFFSILSRWKFAFVALRTRLSSSRWRGRTCVAFGCLMPLLFYPTTSRRHYFFLASFVPFNHALLRAFVSVDGSIVHWSARVARTVATFWTSGEVV